jgi:hypothetical protein
VRLFPTGDAAELARTIADALREGTRARAHDRRPTSLERLLGIYRRLGATHLTVGDSA